MEETTMEKTNQESEGDPTAEIISLRQSQGLTIDQLHERYPNMSRAKIGRVIHGVSKKIPNRETKRDISNETSEIAQDKSHGNMRDISPQISQEISLKSQDSASINIDKFAYYNKLPQKDAIIQLMKENAMLQSQVRNDGHGSQPYYEDAESELDREMAKYVKAKRYSMIMGEGKTEAKEDKGIEILLKAIEVVQKMTPQHGKSDVEQLLEATAINLLKKGTAPEGEVNDHSLKLEEMKEPHEIDLLRLQWEMSKYKDEKQSAAQTIQAIKEILGGSVGEVIKIFGNAGAERVRAMGSRTPKIVEIQCPGCGKMFKADGNSNVIICGHCGSQLLKQGQPQQQELPSIQEVKTEVSEQPPKIEPETPMENVKKERAIEVI
jgi:DNA-directed RNA polymerase subunit RPC12/RpoP